MKFKCVVETAIEVHRSEFLAELMMSQGSIGGGECGSIEFLEGGNDITGVVVFLGNANAIRSADMLFEHVEHPESCA